MVAASLRQQTAQVGFVSMTHPGRCDGKWWSEKCKKWMTLLLHRPHRPTRCRKRLPIRQMRILRGRWNWDEKYLQILWLSSCPSSRESSHPLLSLSFLNAWARHTRPTVCLRPTALHTTRNTQEQWWMSIECAVCISNEFRHIGLISILVTTDHY